MNMFNNSIPMYSIYCMTHSSFVLLIWYVHSFSHCIPYMVCPLSEHIASSARQRKKIGRSLEDLKEMLEKLFKQLADIVAAITNYLCALPSLSIPIMQDVVMALNSFMIEIFAISSPCLLYTSPSPRDRQKSRMPSSA